MKVDSGKSIFLALLTLTYKIKLFYNKINNYKL